MLVGLGIASHQRQGFLPGDSTVINIPPNLDSGHRLFRETLYHDFARNHVSWNRIVGWLKEMELLRQLNCDIS
jgi:hypothetical protein